MKSILELYKRTNNINQAYLLVGDIGSTVTEINSIIIKISGCPITGNSDYYICNTNVFDIAETKRLKQASQSKSVSGGKRFFVIAAEVFLENAQNALLKTLEEPIEGNHFFIITHDARCLLPTVVSRLIKIENFGNKSYEVINNNVILCKKFLSAGVADRILMIGEIIKENDEARVQKSATRNFIKDVENIVFNKYRKGELDYLVDIGTILSSISKVSDYSNDPASASKMLLEYLSLICPRLEEKKDK